MRLIYEITPQQTGYKKRQTDWGQRERGNGEEKDDQSIIMCRHHIEFKYVNKETSAAIKQQQIPVLQFVHSMSPQMIYIYMLRRRHLSQKYHVVSPSTSPCKLSNTFILSVLLQMANIFIFYTERSPPKMHRNMYMKLENENTLPLPMSLVVSQYPARGYVLGCVRYRECSDCCTSHSLHSDDALHSVQIAQRDQIAQRVGYWYPGHSRPHPFD